MPKFPESVNNSFSSSEPIANAKHAANGKMRTNALRGYAQAFPHLWITRVDVIFK